MLREEIIKEVFKLKYKQITKKNFSINQNQEKTIENFLEELTLYNNKINLVGKSTMADPWRSHILDSIQITNIITNKNSRILDMGTGAGFPGLILSILGYRKVTLVDSSRKKISFLKEVCKKLDIDANILLQRIELIQNNSYDFLTSRALANLNKLLFYSHKLIHKHTVMVFLKGQNATSEINDAKKNWDFSFSVLKSLSDDRGKILIINKLSTIRP